MDSKNKIRDITHELNNSLGGIILLVQLLLQDSDEKSREYKDLKKIESLALGCKKMADDIKRA